MKRFAFFAAIVALSAPVFAAHPGDRGYYGRIDINGMPAPPTVYRQPIVVQPQAAARDPIYLNVPPGHAKNWSRYCSRYDAGGEPAHFVPNRWYNDRYVPQYRERRGGGAQRH
jgi:hypothetical protein